MEEPRLLGVAQGARKWVVTSEEGESGEFSETHSFGTFCEGAGRVGMGSTNEEPSFEDRKADVERLCAQASGSQPAMPQ